MMKWQERYARWLMRPKWPKRFNAAVEPYIFHWWFFMGIGLVLAGAIIFPLLPIVNPLDTPPEINDFRNMDQMWAEIAFFSLKVGACLFGWTLFLYFTVIGFIHEERKGYRMIIDHLEAENEASTK